MGRRDNTDAAGVHGRTELGPVRMNDTMLGSEREVFTQEACWPANLAASLAASLAAKSLKHRQRTA